MYCIVLYRIVSCRIVSNRVVSCRVSCVVSCPVVSYCVLTYLYAPRRSLLCLPIGRRIHQFQEEQGPATATSNGGRGRCSYGHIRRPIASDNLRIRSRHTPTLPHLHALLSRAVRWCCALAHDISAVCPTSFRRAIIFFCGSMERWRNRLSRSTT